MNQGQRMRTILRVGNNHLHRTGELRAIDVLSAALPEELQPHLRHLEVRLKQLWLELEKATRAN